MRKSRERDRHARRGQEPLSAKPRRERGWQHVAAWYDELVGERGSEYQREVVIPRTLSLLDLKPSERVLDVACGQGVFCRALGEAGFHALGVDVAPALVDAAKRRNARDRLPIEFRVGDARRLGEVVAAATFDAVVCLLAIQNIAPLSPVWEGCRAALAAGGRLVVVMMHPCFRIPRASGWGWDERTSVQFRRIDRYLSSSKTEIQIHPGSDPSATATTYHRPLQAYVNTLGSAGLRIERIEEWPSHKTSPEGPRKKALDASRHEIPMFLAIRARTA